MSPDDSGPVGVAASVALDEDVSTIPAASAAVVVAGSAETSFCCKLLVSMFNSDEGICECNIY